MFRFAKRAGQENWTGGRAEANSELAPTSEFKGKLFLRKLNILPANRCNGKRAKTKWQAKLDAGGRRRENADRRS
jgi:hypothetical protein